jgi:hypothetical protein
MDLLEHIALFLHFIGWGSLLGGLVVQLREPDKRVNAAMRDGIGLAFLAGLLLVGIMEGSEDGMDRGNAWVAVKFVIALVILVLTMANMRKERIPGGLYWGLLALTLGNMGIAIFW